MKHDELLQAMSARLDAMQAGRLELEHAADQINLLICEAEKRIQEFKPTTTASVALKNGWWLACTKLDKVWRLCAIRPSHSTAALTSAPLEVRLEAVDKLLDLIDKMRDEQERMTAVAREKLESM